MTWKCFREPPTILISIDVIAMATALRFFLSFVISRNAFTEFRLNATAPEDFIAFVILMPLSKGYLVAASIALLLMLLASINAIVIASSCYPMKVTLFVVKNISALGTGLSRSDIGSQTAQRYALTIHDPRKSRHLKTEMALSLQDEEKDLAGAGALLAGSDSVASEGPKASSDTELSVVGPIIMEQSAKVLRIRPSRHWVESAVAKKLDDRVHTILSHFPANY